MEIARRHIFHELDVVEEWLGLGRPALRRTIPWLAATLVLGGLFVAGQVNAWSQLKLEGFAFDGRATPATYYFYLITGIHAAHLVLGLLALTGCLATLGFLRKVEYRQIAVDSLAWFWHTMGIVWLLLFGLLAMG
jgi:cytochrome c oxidase subunit 3